MYRGGRLTRTGWVAIAVFGALGMLIALATLVAAPPTYRATALIVPEVTTTHGSQDYTPDGAAVRRVRATLHLPGTVVVRSRSRIWRSNSILEVEAASTNSGAAARLANAMAPRLIPVIEKGDTRKAVPVRASVLERATVPSTPVGLNWSERLWVGLVAGVVTGGAVVFFARSRLARQPAG